MGFIVLIAMSTALFVGTTLVGHIPLAFKLSQSKIQAFSTYGGGLLLGAALSIVIPEGIEAVYDAAEKGDEHNSTWVAVALLLGFLCMYLIDEMQSHPHTHVKSSRDSDAEEDKPDAKAIFRRRSGLYTLPRRLSAFTAADCIPSSNIPVPINGSTRPSSDRLISSLSARADDEERDYNSHDEDYQSDPERPHPSRRASSAPSVHGSAGSKSLSTTIGLICHSLADGISLGASSATTLSSSSGVSLDIVVFLAIVVHKAPAAFGLTSVLLGDGWSRMKVRQALIAFALAAPVGAVAVYFVLKAVAHVGHGADEATSLKWWTGMALLFSGGTFLFVAAQVTQEQHPSIEEEEETRGAKWKRIALSTAGMISPLLLRLVAGHGH